MHKKQNDKAASQIISSTRERDQEILSPQEWNAVTSSLINLSVRCGKSKVPDSPK